jgi:hypothetical protein
MGKAQVLSSHTREAHSGLLAHRVVSRKRGPFLLAMGAVLIAGIACIAITTGRAGAETRMSSPQVAPPEDLYLSGAKERARIIARITASGDTMAPERVTQAQQAMRHYADSLTRHPKTAGHVQLLDVKCYSAGCVASFQSDSPAITEEIRDNWMDSADFDAWRGGKIYTPPLNQNGMFLSEWILLSR